MPGVVNVAEGWTIEFPTEVHRDWFLRAIGRYPRDWKKGTVRKYGLVIKYEDLESIRLKLEIYIGYYPLATDIFIESGNPIVNIFEKRLSKGEVENFLDPKAWTTF